MLKAEKPLILILALRFFSCDPAFPQVIPHLPKFDHITVNNGLAHSDAMTVAHDSVGFIWIGTNKGIDRYDGNKLKNYAFEVDNHNSLSDNRIRSLYVSLVNELWAGTENGGLNYYDRIKDRFVRVDERVLPPAYRSVAHILAKSFVTCMAANDRGQLFAGTRQHGVFILQRNPKNYFVSIERGVLGNEKITDFEVVDIKTGNDMEVWIGTAANGILQVSPTQSGHTLMNFEFPSRNIRALHIDQEQNIWVGAGQKIYIIQTPSFSKDISVVETTPTNAFPGIAALHVDSFNRLWVGTGYGLYIIHPSKKAGNKPEHPLIHGHAERILPQDAVSDGLNSGRIHKIIEDQFKVIWIATSAGGINKVNLLAKQFELLQRRFTKGNSLPSNYINAIYKEEEKGILWIATRNGFSKYDIAQKTYTNYLSNELGGDATGMDVSSIFQSSDGNLWIGTWFDGFIHLRKNGNQEVLERHTARAGSLSSNDVISFAEDAAGFIWVSTESGGLNKFTKRGQYQETYSTRNGTLPTDNLRILFFEAPGNVLWATTKDAGLLKLDVSKDAPEVLKQFSHDPDDTLSLSINYTWPLLNDHRGNLWIGTIGGGLHQLVRDSTGKETIVRYSKWLPESDVESIEEDDKGNLWIGGAGLLRFNPENKQFLKFDVSDGLQSNSFKVGASCRARDGTLYFGGINGITYFQPEMILLNPYPPNVIISGLRIFNKPVQIDEEVNGRVLLTQNLQNVSEIVIEARENDFSIDFVGMHYANSNKNSYAYKLVGYHENWVFPPSGQLTANFANLTSGSYTFLVKASNGDGVWSEKPASVRISVLPPWWKTWWAFTIYACMVLGILMVYRSVTATQHELKNQLTLEKVQHDKDQELNDLKLSFFRNVSHELRTPLTLILGPLEELINISGKFNGMRDRILLMHRQVRKLLDLINQLLDFQKIESDKLSLRAGKGNIVKFLNEIFLMFKLKADEAGINYSFVSSLNEVEVYFDRNKLEIVLVNLLSNAFKYTPQGGKIQVTFSIAGDSGSPSIYQDGVLHQNYCAIHVKDWGVGIDSEELDKIFDVYYQATHTETMHVLGTGIGLSLVKKIINRHKGEISVKSELGRGTEFVIRLALGTGHFLPEDLKSEGEVQIGLLPTSNNLSENAANDLIHADDEQVIRDSQILIVEDNEDVSQYLQKIFEPLMKVELASNGLDGFKKAFDSGPDIILSDIMMPICDGIELCKKIRQNPQTMHIPILLLTARVATVHELEGLESGADDYIAKPFNPSILKAKVITTISNRNRLKEFYNRQILLEPTEIVIPDKDRSFLEKSMKIVEDCIESRDFSVQLLIREVGMSQSVFYRRIKSITGLSAIEFIRDVRLKRAAQFLKNSDMRISEIALKVGFEDLKYFRKTFQQRYHMTPAAFAKKNQLSGIA